MTTVIQEQFLWAQIQAIQSYACQFALKDQETAILQWITECAAQFRCQWEKEHLPNPLSFS